jgi:diguanylate cyclase (GGDEF)-like protein/putative nucleotidyltransferase with HDIG domain
MAFLGLLQLVSSTTAWAWPQPKLFFIYVCMAIMCSALQLRFHGSGAPPLSANVPVILLSILQLGMPEAAIVGAAGALAQGLLHHRTRSHWLHLALGVGVAATAIATADLVFRSLIPNSIQSSTLRLLAASLVLFFVNTFPVAMATWSTDQQRLGKFWKESYSWLVPYYLVSAGIANAANAATIDGFSLQTALFVLPSIYVAYRYYRVQKSSMEMREKTAERTAALHLRTIEGLALAVEAKDSLNTRGHLRRVRVYALGVGRALGLQGDEIEALQAAALLHDIGKLAVPEYILSKPGKLTPEEFARMKVHPIVGAEIIEQVQFPYAVAPIVRAHHEKWDGTGYPFGLKGTDIPMGARILTAVDYLDALASDREYRRALPLDEAMQRVAAEAGKTLDPEVVKVLGEHYRELEQSAKAGDEPGVELSKNIAVDRGKAPDAGLDLWALAAMPLQGSDHLNTIAAAGREKQMLQSLTQGLGLSLDLETLLERIDSGLQPLIPCDAMAIFVPQGTTLVTLYSAGAQKKALRSEVRAGEGLVGWVAQNRQPIVNGNPEVEHGFQAGEEQGLRAALAAPFQHTGDVAGVLAFYRRDRDSFTADDLRILTRVAPRIGTAIENALKVKELQERASMDVTTGLPTLRAMHEALDVELVRAQRQSQTVALVLLRFGGLAALRPQGTQFEVDEALRGVARLLRASCRGYDHIARIGDETFTMILPGMKQKPLAIKLERLYAASARIFPELLENGTIRFEVGWAHYPEDAVTAKLILAIAEGRLDRQTGSLSENLLALHTHHRRDTATTTSAAETPAVAESPTKRRPEDKVGRDLAEREPAVVRQIGGAPSLDR